MERFDVRCGRATLAGERQGDGEPVVVALHAGVGDRRSWRALAPLLPGTVVTYDRRGFGDTAAPPEDHSHVEDLLAVLDAQTSGPVWLLGSSQGGRIAVDLTLAHPERVAGLVLVSPALSGEAEFELTPQEQRLAEALDAAEEDEDAAAVNRLEAHIWLDGPSAPEGRVGGELRDLFLDMNGRALEAPDPGEAQEPPDATRRIGEIRCPVLLLWGDLDVAGVVARCEWLAGRLPAADTVVVAGTAHLPYLERPADVADAIRSKIR